ncbi:MAG TPA: hypothetical protein PLZ21_08935 [Armatimonadota bacterium]|jgi:hypothetical protein|nr:hypothetical protein [Armatimonadota bacterium]HOM71255.1 hypothetical protein [Armatimonadota bacterium]HOP80672.1 hypothetical protein [Armatimonadota bacterium]
MDEEIHVEREQEAGRRGGAAAAYAPAGATGVTAERAVPLWQIVRWGAIWAALFITLALQIWLVAIGYAVAAPTAAEATEVFTGLGLWIAIASLISLFIGGYAASRLAGVVGYLNGMWHGITLWGFVFSLAAILGALGVAGIFGGILGPGGVTGVTPSQAQAGELLRASSTAAWYFVLGQFLALLAAAGGGVVGARSMAAEEESGVS